MAEKEIQLLQKQIQKLNDTTFDLNTWKNSTILILDKIFGRDSEKINMIRNLNYDYSSWTLRDTTGVSALEIVRKLGKEILETAIIELELYGVPEHLNNERKDFLVIREALEDELRISQYRELISIIHEAGDRAELKNRIAEKLKTYGDETVREILARILSHPTVAEAKF